MNSEQNNIVKEKDYKFYIFILQIISCVVILFVAICLRFFGGNIYKTVSRKFNKEFLRKTSVSEVLETNEKTTEINKKTVVNKATTGSVANNIVPVSTVKNYCSNKLIWPLKGTVTSKFGEREDPLINSSDFHKGVDISVAENTKVRCSFNGIVKETGFNNSYGNYIIIKHSENLETLYAHCNKISVNKNSTVKQGEIIALSGNTGRTTGPHLHFEVKIGSKKVDPLLFLSN